MNILIGILTGITLLAAILGGLVFVVCGIGRHMDADDADTLKQIEKWRDGK